MGVRTKRFRWAVGLFLAAALVLSACGSSSPSGTDGGSQSGGQTDTTPSTQDGGSTTPAPQQPAAQEKVLVWGRGGDSVSLDPIQVTDGESLKVTHQIYEGLLDYAPGSTEVVPVLATEWEASPDGLEWTFKLRQGVKFHDGTDFNAEAVKINFDRWRNTSDPLHVGGEFPYYSYMFGGFDEASNIQDVIVVDDYTVKFVLKNIQASFLQDIAMVPFAIASPKALQENPERLNDHPVGTGPFRFVSWTKGDRIVLEANPDYWGGKPAIDRLIYRSIPDNNARLVALQAGELDVMDGVEPAFLPTIQATGQFDIIERPPMNIGYLAFNTQKPPFDNVLIRRAINHAINKEELNTAFYGGMGIPAVSPLPPSVWGHNPNVPKYEYDPEKAKELLAQAGYGPDNPLKTELWAMPVPRPYMPQPERIGVAIQNYLREVGIEAEIVTYEWGTYLEKTGMGEHTMALLGWTGDNGDPDNFLYVLLDKDNAVTPDAGNIAFYVNDEVHDLLIRARQTTDQAERTRLYEEAQVKIMEDAPWVPLMHTRVPIAVRKGITGYVPNPTGSESLAKVSLP
ncbi:ABC transporter substrate-binding protein [Symbiobacterium thermophilum]|uniref:ABC transporter substrate-binding protein n=1 Tax=Symbiobacterium thermophilum TaxID=2734 RepID=UPI0002DE85A0|nr:ABC transporter substrate-binding protein [Symbiobacterium thermophilum]